MDGLKSFGLTGYEIKLYDALLTRGRSSARQLSKYSGVPPTATYPHLDSLEQKGLIKYFDGKVKEFEIINPRLALPALAKKKTDELEQVGNALIPLLEAKKDARFEEIPDPIELSSGISASITLSSAFLREAKHRVTIIGWGFRTRKSIFNALHEMKKAALRGIEVRIIFGDRNPQTELLAKELSQVDVLCKYYPMKNCSIILADGKECKLTLKRKSLPERTNIHISDIDLVSAFEQYSLLLWEKAFSFT